MQNLLKIFILLAVYGTSTCHALSIMPDEVVVFESDLMELAENATEVPTTTEVIKDELEVPQAEYPDISDSETSHVLTGDLFELRMTIKHDWSDDLTDKKSMKFMELANAIVQELTSYFDNELNIENSIQRESFMLVNVLPSSKDGYVYVTVIVEASEHVTGQKMFDSLDLKFRLYNRIYELEIAQDGFEFKAISNDYLKKFEEHVECDNDFCKPTLDTSHPDPSSAESFESTLPSHPTQTCDPDNKFRSGSTSIYIFENNQKCVENIKKRSLVSKFDDKKCNVVNRSVEEVENISMNNDSEELAVAESKVDEQTDKTVTEKDDEVIVVIRKRGDKVFIEI